MPQLTRIFYLTGVFLCFQQVFWAQEAAKPPLLQGQSLEAERPFFSVEQALENPDIVIRLYADELNDSPEAVFSAIEQLPKLKGISLSGALCYTLPKELLAKKEEIEEIAILGNEVILWDKLAEQLAQFPNLQHLKLQLPSEQSPSAALCQLKQLKHLSIIESRIDTLPDCFCELKNLEILDLRSAGVRKLPEDIGKLKKLRALYLGPAEESPPNPLAKLPEGLSKLKNLEHLDLGYLGIKEMPDLSKLKKLEWLHLAGCSSLNSRKLLEHLSHASKLQYLNLNDIKLQTLPKTIYNWENLQSLHLRYCQLSFFPTHKQWNDLKEIDLYGNAFEPELKERLEQRFLRIGADVKI